jgi:hypothetical protein
MPLRPRTYFEGVGDDTGAPGDVGCEARPSDASGHVPDLSEGGFRMSDARTQIMFPQTDVQCTAWPARLVLDESMASEISTTSGSPSAPTLTQITLVNGRPHQ